MPKTQRLHHCVMLGGILEPPLTLQAHGFMIDGVAFQHETGVLFRHRVPLHCNSNSEGRKLVTLTL